MRHVAGVTLAAMLVVAAFASACDDSSLPAGCAAGTTPSDGGCVAPIDATTGVDAGAEAEAGPTGPSFDGAREAAPAGPTKIFVTWNAAVDPTTPPERMRYAIFVAEGAGPMNYAAPVATTTAGATTFVLEGLKVNATYTVGVRAVNDANVSDANTAQKSATTADDATPPVFAGVKSAKSKGGGIVTLAWDAATDDLTPAGAIRYSVYAIKGPGLPPFVTPTIGTAPGATSIDVPGLDTPDTAYTFVVRARDAADNVDDNTVTATTVQDTVPPTFAGLTGATLDPVARTVALTWDPGSDDSAAVSDLVYDVYEGTASQGENFLRVRATSAPGATGMTVTSLLPDTSLFWVVRARDRAGNHDSNTVEQTGTTYASYGLEVQQMFTEDCAVVGCHVPGNPPAGLILARGFSYNLLVGVTAAEQATPRIDPGSPSTSYLYKKITAAPGIVGSQMPAPNTNSTLTQDEKDLVARWINQGAPNN